MASKLSPALSALSLLLLGAGAAGAEDGTRPISRTTAPHSAKER